MIFVSGPAYDEYHSLPDEDQISIFKDLLPFGTTLFLGRNFTQIIPYNINLLISAG